jgi:hypothetical protein
MKQFYTNKLMWVIALTTGTVLLLALLVKTVFTTWELIHILIPLVLLSPIAASLFGKRLQVELNETVYVAILIAPPARSAGSQRRVVGCGLPGEWGHADQ